METSLSEAKFAKGPLHDVYLALEGWEGIKIIWFQRNQRKLSGCLDLEFLDDDTVFSEVTESRKSKFPMENGFRHILSYLERSSILLLLKKGI